MNRPLVCVSVCVCVWKRECYYEWWKVKWVYDFMIFTCVICSWVHNNVCTEGLQCLPIYSCVVAPTLYPCRSQPWCSMEKFINILGDLWHNLYNSNNGILGTLNGHVVGRAAGLMRECRLGFTVQAESGQVEKWSRTASRKLSKKGSNNPHKGFSFSPSLQRLTLCFPLSDLSMVSYSFSFLSTQPIEVFFSHFLLLSLLSHSHMLSLSGSLFYIWPIIRLKNTQHNLFLYNEYSPSLVNPSLQRQSLSSGLLWSFSCDWSHQIWVFTNYGFVLLYFIK